MNVKRLFWAGCVGSVEGRVRDLSSRFWLKGACDNKAFKKAAELVQLPRTAEVEDVDLVDALGVRTDAVGELVGDGEVQLDGCREDHVSGASMRSIYVLASRTVAGIRVHPPSIRLTARTQAHGDWDQTSSKCQ